jgi:hypothetical protein
MPCRSCRALLADRSQVQLPPLPVLGPQDHSNSGKDRKSGSSRAGVSSSPFSGNGATSTVTSGWI